MEKPTWSQRWDDFLRAHPLVLLLLTVAAAFLATPLMIAASKATAVLYQDF
jgi:hypothetical protein